MSTSSSVNNNSTSSFSSTSSSSSSQGSSTPKSSNPLSSGTSSFLNRARGSLESLSTTFQIPAQNIKQWIIEALQAPEFIDRIKNELVGKGIEQFLANDCALLKKAIQNALF